jgi:hypothetical protein
VHSHRTHVRVDTADTDAYTHAVSVNANVFSANAVNVFSVNAYVFSANAVNVFSVNAYAVNVFSVNTVKFDAFGVDGDVRTFAIEHKKQWE